MVLGVSGRLPNGPCQGNIAAAVAIQSLLVIHQQGGSYCKRVKIDKLQLCISRETEQADRTPGNEFMLRAWCLCPIAPL